MREPSGTKPLRIRAIGDAVDMTDAVDVSIGARVAIANPR